MRKINGFGFNAPYFKGLKKDMCARYARLAANKLSGVNYIPANAWDLSKKNKLVKELKENESLMENIELLLPKKTIVTFYDPKSLFNAKGRKVTHAALFLGKTKEDLFFAEQRGKKQQIISYSNIKKQGLEPKEIIGPKL